MAVAAAPCEAPPGFTPRERLQSDEVAIVYRLLPPTLELGRHFAVEAIVCDGGAGPPGRLRVDAEMPEHRHGMNYRPTVTAEAGGRYRADGLLFHMPGRWELVFEIRAAGRTDRLTRSLDLE